MQLLEEIAPDCELSRGVAFHQLYVSINHFVDQLIEGHFDRPPKFLPGLAWISQKQILRGDTVVMGRVTANILSIKVSIVEFMDRTHWRWTYHFCWPKELRVYFDTDDAGSLFDADFVDALAFPFNLPTERRLSLQILDPSAFRP